MGSGDMLAAIYDPTGKRTDVFGCLDREFATQAGSILLTCKSGKPETAFQILLKGERQ